MLPACRSNRAVRAGFGLAALLAVGVTAGTLALGEARAATLAQDAPEGSQPRGRSAVAPSPTSAGATLDHSPSRAEPRGREDVFRPSRSLLLRRASSGARAGGSEGWYLGMAGITLALAVCGGVVATARRFSSQGTAGEIRVVSRVSLSPKHTIYLLRVGRRVLLVGTGPQGAPSLISELDELAEIEPGPRQGEEA
ncbi:MAG: flagellar biosynthetic protein FliO [Isosphaerales bacterium]